ncbi:Nif11 family protein [Azospirillum sp. RWY-5-1]|uniref:Nif11 family protein n=1 Tax=Azospirillum oleiclasticum TaxID=2735135 RepID=A0ABX2TGL7_9PROT|nr:Nif11 family protein [Azospirillum oleiclasticum]NYZ15409.1 Nif11 family protein [Azospirillum oleiclasticum]NYZ22431.1 Nif11 family protein [Azospirillum oleiclasticum]
MAHGEFIRFLVETQENPVVMAQLMANAPWLTTGADIARFASQHGFRFTAQDVPLGQLQTPQRPQRAA